MKWPVHCAPSNHKAGLINQVPKDKSSPQGESVIDLTSKIVYFSYPGFPFAFMRVNRRISRKNERRRLSLLLFIIFSFSIFVFLSFLPKKDLLPEEEKEIPQPQFSKKIPPPPEEHKWVILKGVTLTDILASHDFSPTEVHRLREEVKAVYDLAKIKAGHEIRIYTSPEGKVLSLEYDIDDTDYLFIQKKSGIHKAEIKKIPYEYRTEMIWSIIEDNLIFAVEKENEGDLLALSFAELFGWDIDFYTDPRKGDTFKILFEKKYLNNKFVGYRNILAAEYTSQDKTYQAFRYTYPDTEESDYFDPEGKSLRKEFRRSPIKFGRITSRYSRRRFHPIRKVYRPHYGVDYAAPIGTEVQATADGTVTFRGWNGASGRMVKIRHKNEYETMYLHLRSYARGIRKGARVQSGQVIGCVGSSGESTGPHLDYRIKYRGRFINPLAAKFKPVEPLRAEFLEDYKEEVRCYCLCLEAPPLVFSSLCSSMIP
jgi:murein DD-endopeptidase MepM/ murein hydrolase activator NlpD